MSKESSRPDRKHIRDCATGKRDPILPRYVKTPHFLARRRQSPTIEDDELITNSTVAQS